MGWVLFSIEQPATLGSTLSFKIIEYLALSFFMGRICFGLHIGGGVRGSFDVSSVTLLWMRRGENSMFDGIGSWLE